MANNTETLLSDAEYKRLSSEQDRKARAHATAELIARQFNEFAPDPAPHESSINYRRRLAANFQKYSPENKNVDLKLCAPDAFGIFETKIYADAASEAIKPTSLTIPAGQVVERITTDPTGRRIKNYYGDPEAVWGMFKAPAKVVVGFNTTPGDTVKFR